MCTEEQLELLEEQARAISEAAAVLTSALEGMVEQAGVADALVAQGLIMDLDRHEVRAAGEAVLLSAKQFNLLHLLLRHQGKVVRRERLLHEVWGDDYFGDTRTPDTHIGWLRKKVEAKGEVQIVAVRGVGYRLDLKAATRESA